MSDHQPLTCSLCTDVLAHESMKLGPWDILPYDMLPDQHGHDGRLISLTSLRNSAVGMNGSGCCLGCKVLFDAAMAYWKELCKTQGVTAPNIDGNSRVMVNFLTNYEFLTCRLVAPEPGELEDQEEVAAEQVDDEKAAMEESEVKILESFKADDRSFEIYIAIDDFGNFSDAETPWTALSLGNSISTEPLSSHNLGLIKLLLSQCETGHSQCSFEADAPMPTRVLTIDYSKLHSKSGEDEMNDNDIHIRLNETSGVNGRYIALSHQWGPPEMQPLRTLKHNIEQMKHGVPFNTLPRSFGDLIKLAIILGVEHVWIDSLCILQDDPLDWEREAARMTQVYENSYLTVSAGNASSSRAGFIKERTLPAEAIGLMILVHLPNHNQAVPSFGVSVRKRRHPRRGLETVWMQKLQSETQSVLKSRAWCFQEHMLPRRVLEFLEDELIFTCDTAIKCECRGILHEKPGHNRRNLRQIDSDDSGDVSDAWRECITHYSGRNLTYFKDRFPAISGVARFFAERLLTSDSDTGYMAGLWKHSIEFDLQWLIPTLTNPERTEDHLSHAPSWSWASNPNQVNWMTRGGGMGWFDVYNEAKLLLSSNIVHGPVDPYGGLASKENILFLAAFTMTATVRFSSDGQAILTPKNFQDEDKEATTDLETLESKLAIEVLPDYGFQTAQAEQWRITDGDEVLILLLAQRHTGAYEPSNCMLILRRASNLEEKVVAEEPIMKQALKDGIDVRPYRRIGYASCGANNEYFGFEGASREIVALF